jgi:hypothetical protein
LALALRALGAGDDLIAECLELEPSAVAPLVDVGQRKLEHLGPVPAEPRNPIDTDR